MCHIQRYKGSVVKPYCIIEHFGIIELKCTLMQATACSNHLISVIGVGRSVIYVDLSMANWWATLAFPVGKVQYACLACC